MNAKNILQYSIGPIGAAALSLITVPFIAFFFTVQDVGKLAMLQVVLSLSTSLISLQMHQAYVREYHEQPDKVQLFKATLVPSAVLFLFSIFISLTLPYSVTEALFGSHSYALTIYLYISIFASIAINLLAHVLRMQERGLAFSATQIGPKLLLLLLVCGIVVLRVQSDFDVLMIIHTLALSAALGLFLWLTRSTWAAAISAKINFELLNSMLRFSLPLLAGGLAYSALTVMDRFFLRAYSGFEELGVYALSASLAGVVSVISTVFSNLWHPIVYKWIRTGIEPHKVQAVSEFMLLLVAFIWTIAGLLSRLLLYFLPADYAAIEYLIVACVAMQLFYTLSETTVVGIGITRRSNFSMLASVIAFLVNIFLGYLFIPAYGASGAVLVSVIAFFVFFLIRTESSAFLWQSLPRARIYIVVLMYTGATFLMVLTQGKGRYMNSAWIGLLIMTTALFWTRVIQAYSFANQHLARKS